MVSRFSLRYARALASVLLLAASAGTAFASEGVRPFVAGSYAQILAERQGRPFIVALWSAECTHCPAELKTLARLKRSHPTLDIVLVATDDIADAARTRALAEQFGHARAPQWIFADLPERLRFEIDRRWYGELPRTLFFDREHKVEAVSGLVPEERLQRWVQTNVRGRAQ